MHVANCPSALHLSYQYWISREISTGTGHALHSRTKKNRLGNLSDKVDYSPKTHGDSLTLFKRICYLERKCATQLPLPDNNSDAEGRNEDGNEE